MKKLKLVALVAAGLLVAAGTAQAKEVVSLKVCGASGCAEIDRAALKDWWRDESGEPEQVPYTAPAEYYRVQLGFGDQSGSVIHTEKAFYLAGSDLMRIQDDSNSWWKVLPNQADVLHDAVSGLEPFTPAPTRVTVDGKKVSDPNSYLRLVGKLAPVYSYPSKPGIRIVLLSRRATPWTERVERMSYVPKKRILVRRDGAFRLSKAMGRQLMRRASLASVPGSSSHTALYAGIGAAGAVAVGLLLGIGRRKARDS